MEHLTELAGCCLSRVVAQIVLLPLVFLLVTPYALFVSAFREGDYRREVGETYQAAFEFWMTLWVH